MFPAILWGIHPTGDPCSCCRHYAIHVKLGDLVKEGDVIAWIGEHEIKAPMTGMVRGC